jgi:low affinity Fe/Cu permease
VINTGTTIVTFLMVFLVQNTQNRDSRSLHLKLDELLRATAGARTAMADLDTLSDDDLARLEQAFKRLRTLRRAAVPMRPTPKQNRSAAYSQKNGGSEAGPGPSRPAMLHEHAPGVQAVATPP